MAHWVTYRRISEGYDEAFGRDEIVELEASAFHEADAHPDPLATCKRGCWEAAEVAFDDTLRAGELVVANIGT